MKSVANIVHGYARCEAFIGLIIAPRNEHDDGVNDDLRMSVPMSRSERMRAFGFRVPITTMFIPTPSVVWIGIRAVRDILRNPIVPCVGRIASDIDTGRPRPLRSSSSGFPH